MAQKYIRTEYADGKVVFSNIRNQYTNDLVTYTKVDTWYDGTPMDDTKPDGVIYRKLGDEYVILNIIGSIPVEYFGAVGDGVTDDTAAFFKAREYANRATLNRGKTNYPVGIKFSKRYFITESPMWAIQNLRLETEGMPEIICTNGNMVLDLWFTNPSSGPTLGRGVSNMKVGDFLLTGGPTTQVICGIRAVSRSTFGTIMAREGDPATGAAFQFQAGVCNVFNKLICSWNTNYQMVNIPAYGMRFTQSVELGRTTACEYSMVVMEGVKHGIYMNNSSADLCTFSQGTSEGNETGITIGTVNRNNVFIDMAMEVNSSYDIMDRGQYTVIRGGYSQSHITFEGALFPKISSIRAQRININSATKNAMVRDLTINNWQDTDTLPAPPKIIPVGGIYITALLHHL